MSMEWHHGLGIVIGLASLLLIVAISVHDRRRGRREDESHRRAIQNAMCDAEIIMSGVSSLSRDYDYMDGDEAAARIAAYAQRNAPKIERCMGEIRLHSLFLRSDDPLRERVSEAVSALDWFADVYYSGDGGRPSLKQRVVWSEGREEIGEKIDLVREVAENMRA